MAAPARLPGAECSAALQPERSVPSLLLPEIVSSRFPSSGESHQQDELSPGQQVQREVDARILPPMPSGESLCRLRIKRCHSEERSDKESALLFTRPPFLPRLP